MFCYLSNAVYRYRAQARKMTEIEENIVHAVSFGDKTSKERFQDLLSKKPAFSGKTEGASCFCI
jgi:hypothetical protein